MFERSKKQPDTVRPGQRPYPYSSAQPVAPRVPRPVQPIEPVTTRPQSQPQAEPTQATPPASAPTVARPIITQAPSTPRPIPAVQPANQQRPVPQPSEQIVLRPQSLSTPTDTPPPPPPQTKKPRQRPHFPKAESLRNTLSSHRKLIIVVLLIAAIITAGWYAYTYFVRLSVANLERAEASDTSFLYPKQWDKLKDTTYGTGESVETSNSLVSIKKSSYATAAYKSQPASVITTYRSALLANTTALSIEETFDEFLPCDSLSDVKKDLFKQENELAIGLIQLSARCKRQDGETKVEARLFLGNDGYLRYIYVATPEASWNKNAEVYQAILSSVDQAG